MKNFLSCKKRCSLYFIGVGGVSMSGLALYSLSQGFLVSGSDITKSETTQKLEEKGVKVYYGHSASNVENCDVVIYTSAIANDNEELLTAKKLGKVVFERTEFLAKILSEYQFVIAVSGCHGKTTVTAMLTHIFSLAKKSVTSFIGGYDTVFSNFTLGGDKTYCICEACEFKRNFLALKPTVAVVTNIDNDHLDCYNSLEDIKKAFSDFTFDKITIFNADDQNSRYNFSGATITFGIDEPSQIRAVHLKANAGYYSFTVSEYGVKKIRLNLKIQGKHNVYNALSAIAVARYYGIEYKHIKKAIENFTGVLRRGEVLGVLNGVKFLADYAHHPNEINAVLSGVDISETAIIFQPHTFSRTKHLKNDFIKSLQNFDVAVYETFSARENYDAEGSAYSLYDGLKKINPFAEYLPDKRSLIAYLNKKIKNKKQIIFLGAGDIYFIAKEYLLTIYKTD